MQNVLADLAVESEAATALAIRLAAALDAGESRVPAAGRCRREVLGLQAHAGGRRPRRMEVLGGNGYVEESGLPRLYRQAPLNSIWEGSGNVIALDVLRAMGRSVGDAGRRHRRDRAGPRRRRPVRRGGEAAARRARRPRRSCRCGPAGSPGCWPSASRARCSCGTPRRRSRTRSAPPAWAGTGGRSSARCPPASRGRARSSNGLGHPGLSRRPPATVRWNFAGDAVRWIGPGGPARAVARTRGAGGAESGQRAQDDRRAARGRVDPTRCPASPTPSTTSTATWRFTYVNPAGESLLGRAADEHAGPAVLRLPSRACAARPSRSAFAGGPRRRRPAGLRVPARAVGPLVRDPGLSATPAGSPSIVRDIDERRARRGRPARRPRRARAHRRPGGAALGDRAGRRRRPDPDGEPRLGRQRRAAAAHAGSSPAGSATTTSTAMSRGLRPGRPRGDRGRDAAAAVGAARRRRPAPSSTSTRPRWAPSDRWFRLQAARVAGFPADRGHATPTSPSGCRERAGAGAGRPRTTS